MEKVGLIISDDNMKINKSNFYHLLYRDVISE